MRAVSWTEADMLLRVAGSHRGGGDRMRACVIAMVSNIFPAARRRPGRPRYFRTGRSEFSDGHGCRTLRHWPRTRIGARIRPGFAARLTVMRRLRADDMEVHRMKNRAHLVLIALTTITLAGCATRVEDDTIVSRTAFAIGLESDQFTITGRTGDAGRIDYKVVAQDGRRFNCYVTGGGMMYAGVVTSDAICSEQGSGTVTQCNALLKAAGKC
jgi:hypothetical protein